MSEDPNGTLILDDVVRRFADSEQALGEARAKLDALGVAETIQTAAAGSMEDAAASTATFIQAARDLLVEAEETHRTARGVLEAGANLIDGADLKDIQTGQARVANALREGFGRLEGLIGEVNERDRRIAELETEMARRTAALTKRQRGRLGL